VEPPRGRLNVGYAWHGNPQNPIDRQRSLRSAGFLAALARTGANMIDLQAVPSDFAELAAVVEGLDLVISIDSAIAHLAGAMGKPCWLLLSAHHADSRWIGVREDSPWYPRHRLFRQDAPGDWSGPLRRMEEALGALVAAQ
jgi:ADP-heptose:LPS heptosyltransferase